MIRPDQIPAEAVKAAWQAMMAPDALAMHRAIAAAINAWPEAKRVKGYFTHDTDYYEPAFILPFPQEGDA